MKNFKRILLTAIAAMLLVVMSITGTLAYLNSLTNKVENTFTVGNVTLDDPTTDLADGLDETKTDEYGKPVTPAERTQGNEYKMIPGQTYTKDPTVHVKEGSEPCFLYVKLDNQMIDYLAAETIETQMGRLGWTELEAYPGVWYYKDIIDAREIEDDTTPEVMDSTIDVPVFETITLKSDLTQSQLEDAQSLKIILQAYALQSDNFEDTNNNGTAADDAYALAVAPWTI